MYFYDVACLFPSICVFLCCHVCLLSVGLFGFFVEYLFLSSFLLFMQYDFNVFHKGSPTTTSGSIIVPLSEGDLVTGDGREQDSMPLSRSMLDLTQSHQPCTAETMTCDQSVLSQ